MCAGPDCRAATCLQTEHGVRGQPGIRLSKSPRCPDRAGVCVCRRFTGVGLHLVQMKASGHQKAERHPANLYWLAICSISVWLGCAGPAYGSQATPAADALSEGADLGGNNPGSRSTSLLGLLRSLGEHRIEADGEWLIAQDIRLSDLAVSYGLRDPLWDARVVLSRGDISVDYVNEAVVDALGHREELNEERYSVQVNLRIRGPRSVSWLASGGYYAGFTDYRSLWLNEFYRQRFNGDPGYVPSDPRGWNTSIGPRWDYQPSSRAVQLDLVVQEDQVAPAFEKFPFRPLERRRDLLWSQGVRLSWEAVLNRHLRVMAEAQVLSTTDRELRYSLRPSINWAITDHWVARFNAGYTFERPSYQSGMAGTTLEHDWDNRWFVSVFGRYYHDNGQLNQSLPESTAAPGLETVEMGVGLRLQTDRWGLKVTVGPYYSTYTAIESRLNPFVHLYQNRDWVAVRAAAGVLF